MTATECCLPYVLSLSKDGREGAFREGTGVMSKTISVHAGASNSAPPMAPLQGAATMGYRGSVRIDAAKTVEDRIARRKTAAMAIRRIMTTA